MKNIDWGYLNDAIPNILVGILVVMMFCGIFIHIIKGINHEPKPIICEQCENEL